MAKTNWQDPKTSEMRSTHIAGLMEAVGKVEDSIGMESVYETNVPLTEVFISSDDRYRIFQAPEGKRNWTAEQAPVIKRNGVTISSGFEIDYGGGAIILNVNDTVENTYTADVKYTKTTEIDVSADINAHNTSGTAHDDIRESINDLDADVDGHATNGVHQKVEVTSTDDATSAVNAPLKSAGGLAVAKSIFFGGAKLRHYKSGYIEPDGEFTINVGRGIYFLMISNTGGESDYNRLNAGLYFAALRGSASFVQLIGTQEPSVSNHPRPFTVSKDSNDQLIIKNTSDVSTIIQATILRTNII